MDENTDENTNDVGHDLDDLFERYRVPGEQHGALTRLIRGDSILVVRSAHSDTGAMLRIPAQLRQGAVVVIEPGRRRRVSGEWLDLPEEHMVSLRPQDLETKETQKLLADRSVGLWVVHGMQGEEYAEQAHAALSRLREEHTAPLLYLTQHGRRVELQRLLDLLPVGPNDVYFFGFFKPHLMYDVIRVPGDVQKRKIAQRLATELPTPGIFYCQTARLAKELLLDLHEAGIEARLYHGQLRAKERLDAIQDFSAGKVAVLVASETAPLPRSKDDARFVIHCGAAESLETYYHQALQAGGAGKQARAVLLYDRSDRRIKTMANLLQYPTVAEGLTAYQVLSELHRNAEAPVTVATWADALRSPMKRMRLLQQALRDAGAIVEEDTLVRPVADIPHGAISAVLNQERKLRESEYLQLQELLNYAETRLCRRKVLHRYFGLQDVDACGICDNCRKGTEQRIRLSTLKRRAGETVHAEEPAAEGAVGHRKGWIRGDLVRHPAWGEGEVKQAWGDKLRVHFPGRGEKVLKADFVQPAE